MLTNQIHPLAYSRQSLEAGEELNLPLTSQARLRESHLRQQEIDFLMSMLPDWHLSRSLVDAFFTKVAWQNHVSTREPGLKCPRLRPAVTRPPMCTHIPASRCHLKQIIHVPTFEAQYNAMRELIDQRRIGEIDPAFLSLYFMVSIGCSQAWMTCLRLPSHAMPCPRFLRAASSFRPTAPTSPPPTKLNTPTHGCSAHKEPSRWRTGPADLSSCASSLSSCCRSC